jgi:hypothetical protein
MDHGSACFRLGDISEGIAQNNEHQHAAVRLLSVSQHRRRRPRRRAKKEKMKAGGCNDIRTGRCRESRLWSERRLEESCAGTVHASRDWPSPS